MKESLPEKRHNINERWLYIHELKKFLEEFDDDDWIEVNKVGNLNVYHSPNAEEWSTIDLHWSRVDHWFEEDDDN